MNKIISLGKSRRFWAAVSGVVVVVLHETFGIDQETSNGIAAFLVAWILGDSIHKTQ